MFTLRRRVRGRRGDSRRAWRESTLGVNRLEVRAVPSTLIGSLFPPDITGPQPNAYFGAAVASSPSVRVVGAPNSDVNGLKDVGQVFTYDAVSNKLQAVLENPSPASEDRFGQSIAVSNNIVVVGAPEDDSGQTNAGSVYVYDLNSATPTMPLLTLNNPVPNSGDNFGNAVAISGSYVVIGAYQDDTGAKNSGSAYVYDINSKTPTHPIVTLNSPAPTDNDYFGYSVAISGNFVLIGATQDDTNAIDAGSVYLYDLSSSQVSVPFAVINNPTPEANDNFGNAIAASGNLALIGAYRDDTNAVDAGSVYVYDMNSKVLNVPIVHLNNPSKAVADNFGNSVAISGSLLVVGAKENDAGAENTGAAYVFDLNSSTPSVPIVFLNNPTPEFGERFGVAVAITGKDVLVGAYLESTEAKRGGSAYVYNSGLPTPAVPVATLVNPTSASYECFGYSVAISERYLVVGSYLNTTVEYFDGSAHVYDLTSSTPMLPIANLFEPTPLFGGAFGRSVAVSGNYVVVGGGGLVYVFDMSSSTPETPIASLFEPNVPANFNFGESLAINDNFLLIGAPGHNTAIGGIGSVFAYNLNSPTPSIPFVKIDNPVPGDSDSFGYDIAISGNQVVISAHLDDTGAKDAGSAYVYDLTSTTPGVPILTLNNPYPNTQDSFGIPAISGRYVVIGVPRSDIGANNAGTAYVYDLESATPAVPVLQLTNPNAEQNDGFGISVGISGTQVVVGAYSDNSGSQDAGTAYVYDLNSPSPTLPIATLTNPSPDPDDQFARSIAISGNRVVVGSELDDTQNYNQGAAHIYSLVPPRLASVEINAGAMQRSMVSSIKVNFDIPIGFIADPASAFTLINHSTSIAVALSAVVDPSERSVTLTFTGGSVDGDSLADGRYTLTINADQFAGDGFDGNSDGVAGDDYVLVGTPANGLFRLFADADGNGVVSAVDFAAFRIVYGSAGSIFDFNNDGFTGAADFAQFRLRYGVVI